MDYIWGATIASLKLHYTYCSVLVIHRSIQQKELKIRYIDIQVVLGGTVLLICCVYEPMILNLPVLLLSIDKCVVSIVDLWEREGKKCVSFGCPRYCVYKFPAGRRGRRSGPPCWKTTASQRREPWATSRSCWRTLTTSFQTRAHQVRIIYWNNILKIHTDTSSTNLYEHAALVLVNSLWSQFNFSFENYASTRLRRVENLSHVATNPNYRHCFCTIK